MHDDLIQENAKFRNDAGLLVKVTRIAGSDACQWCAEVAGTFTGYNAEVRQAFRRHDKCSCVLTYSSEKMHSRLSGSTKTWQETPDIPDYQPTRFTQEQARAFEEEQLRKLGLTTGGNSGRINTSRKMSAPLQQAPDFSKYPITENLESVETMRRTISQNLGIPESSINLSGVRNTEVLEPFVKHLQKIQADTGMTFPKIIAMEVVAGDVCCIANYQPMENTFYISSRYFNSKDALEATLKDWASKGILPKQAKSITYLAEHETAHMRIPDSLLETEEAKKIWKKRKLLNQNDADIYEYFADATAIYRMNPNISDSNITKAVEYLRNGGVPI